MSSPLWLLFLLTVTYSLIFSYTQAADSNDLKAFLSFKNTTYIVYMGDLPKTKTDFSVAAVHSNMLQQVIGSRASKSLLHSYKRSFNGFVAKLTEDEKNQLAQMEGVVSVFPSQNKKLHTTRSWDFMGFPQDVKRAPLESDVIVGMLDTGAWPESDSFKDDGFGAPPAKWKGSCASKNFTCNNKLIGAKYYNTDGSAGDEELSARDTEGHGTHTASTAAGRAVNNASMLGLGKGTARGGVPSARIAVYKICWTGGCSDADILAAFDDAIADGVDIISLSVGGSFPLQYFEDTIAIGAFHSMKNGILTSNSAGNDGPGAGSITNLSPWSLSVAASSIDRKFLTQIVLGNNATYEGPTVNTFDGAIHPIVYGGSVPNTKKGFTSDDSRYCEEDSLDPTLVKDKIVVCEDFDGPENALLSGASGVVIEGDFGYDDLAFSFVLPTTYLSGKDGNSVLSYLNSTTTPSASILKSYEPVDKAAPTVVSFSSRGPNLITLDLLKPDLTAPGVDILAAWSMGTTVTGEEGDTRVVPYSIISGTSMSCPHASGAAAYVKSFHPTWSPAAIKSALMTTAATMSPIKNLDAEFAYGSGHIDPLKATDPGLVYDAGESDFVSFLCGQGYNATTLKIVTGDASACSAASNATVWDLNYPSFALSAPQSGSIVRTFNRTVTNVGAAESTYQASMIAPSGLSVKVDPISLSFKSVGETQSFVVTVGATIGSKTLSGSLVWSDGVHKVTSPIVAFLSS
ncbi:cucumisin [Lactuca sativa]|uniref:cucumisin n=1 Tax=Lactuca sativa TaxID=4236 RepID=UPI0022AFC8EB|nr:cucumisin [Lactuca sativa]